MQADFNDIDNRFFYDGTLGAEYHKDKTVFRVWAPLAEEVTLNIYATGNDDEILSGYSMVCENGVWTSELAGDLDGKYYTYTVKDADGERETIDIYARSAGVNGKRGMIFDPDTVCPNGWQDSSTVKLENYTDAVIYELHVRDFSADESGNFKFRGKFKAFTEKNVTNSIGETIGLDYIASLGVTHIHLLPVYDFATVDESSSEPQYNWGYDPLNYNVPEGSYSTDPFDGKSRVREFREMVLAAHKKGIGVIMDVVYNHTYYSEESSFSKTFPGYYYRHSWDGSFSNGSGCGNEFASERRMASKYIVDSLCYLASFYKLDGFRFDLMGLLDISTLNEAAARLRAINPDIILYGEGWTGGASPLEEYLRAMKHSAGKMPEFAFFSDDFRDTVKGNVFSDWSKGYINGEDRRFAEKMRSLLCGGVYHPCVQLHGERYWTDTPCQTVNYVEAHDNLTFGDKLRLTMPGASVEDLIRINKLGASLVFLAQGIPFIQAGQEFFRSKPLPNGGFEHNSYNSPDSVNSLKWDELTPYRSLSDYYKGLIAVRKKFPELRLTSGDEIRRRVIFSDLGGGAFVVRIGRVTYAVNPTWQDRILYAEGNVYIEDGIATGEPLRKSNGNERCEGRSVILIAED